MDQGLVEKKRGRGMFVIEGVRTQLLQDERQRFVDKEWPDIVETITRLQLDVKELLDIIDQGTSTGEESGK